MASKFTLTGDTKYQLLVQISQKVRDTLDLNEILNQLLDLLQTVLDYDAAGIFILNRDTTLPYYVGQRALIAGIAQRGFDPHPVEDDRMLMLGEGITGYVIRSGESVAILDVRLDPRYVVGRQATLSEIAVPIKRNEEIVGALNIESDRLFAFDENDLEVLRFFADAAAISIEKATLHRRLLEKQALEKQMQTARTVQVHLLPAAPPVVTGYDISGVCLTAFDIGGDYFDYIPLQGNKLGIALADIVGDGVPAALVMTAFRALLRDKALDHDDPAQVMTELNRKLPDFAGDSDFVTAIYGILDLSTGQFRYANCGHQPILLFRNGGHLEQLLCGHPALGVYKKMVYTTAQVTMKSGDLLVFFTDGVVEIPGINGEDFGLQRLVDTIWQSADCSSADVIQKVIDTTREYSHLQVYPDDFTLIAVRKVSSGTNPLQPEVQALNKN